VLDRFEQRVTLELLIGCAPRSCTTTVLTNVLVDDTLAVTGITDFDIPTR
jgi:hypothetical protein